MTDWSERPRDMRARDRDNFDFNAPRRQPQPVPGTTTGRGRKMGTMDTGTVALAIGSMAFYWMLPAMMSRRRRTTKTSRPQS
jgi:hypothetical protein